jgi:hypothetical protein
MVRLSARPRRASPRGSNAACPKIAKLISRLSIALDQCEHGPLLAQLAKAYAVFCLRGPSGAAVSSGSVTQPYLTGIQRLGDAKPKPRLRDVLLHSSAYATSSSCMASPPAAVGQQ